MMRRLMIGLATGALVAVMVPGVASAAPWNADIDSNGDCDVHIDDETDINREEPGDVNVAINRKWIIATCHIDLDVSEVGLLGGPFSKAQVYRGFDCGVGNDDDLDDIDATRSHAVVTPSSRMNIFCKAPMPE